MNIKQRTDSVIDLLANKELSFGCEFIAQQVRHTYVTGFSDVQRLREDECVFIRNRDKSYVVSKKNYVFDSEIIGHPVMIGDVLENMRYRTKNLSIDVVNVFLGLWAECGFAKSLNEILSGEVETIPDKQDADGNWCMAIPIHSKRFKDPNAQALLEFIEKTFNLSQ